MELVATRYKRLLWDWTLGGLPGWLYLPGLMTKWSHRIDLDNLSDAAGKFKPGQLVDVLLDGEQLLTKSLDIPIAAKGSLHKVVEVNLRQSLPQGGADLVWTYGIKERNGSKLNVLVHLMRKRDLDALTHRASESGTQIRTVRVAGMLDAPPLLDKRNKTDRPLKVWAAIMLALLASCVGTFWWQHQQTIRALNAELDSLQVLASAIGDEVISLRSSLSEAQTNAASERSEFEQFVAEHRRLPLLLDLTNTLTDDTWISEFELLGDELLLTGFTGDDVATVIEELSRLDDVSKVVLDGPVSFDRASQKNRFSFLLSLETARE
ncbi:PilN domain-containing protein [uncultured Tateyamaria sp.]|uniref:PilN domain-containing protein n=1 Tax=uncultured Tateyamaria sp. TaxID=455651 RepID=UPI00261A6760|nr:PilN domain-containing protein [uncultured Tateyamaria sp.]